MTDRPTDTAVVIVGALIRRPTDPAASQSLAYARTSLTGHPVAGGTPSPVDAAHCFGDSGGPNVLGDSIVIAGVTAFGINPTCAGTGGVYRIDLVADLATRRPTPIPDAAREPIRAFEGADLLE